MNQKKLLDFGFVKNGESYFYETEIMAKSFILCVSIADSGVINTDLTEKENGEKYVLYKTNVTGSFVGKVRNEVENGLRQISTECFETAVFKSEQTKRIIRFAKEIYGDDFVDETENNIPEEVKKLIHAQREYLEHNGMVDPRNLTSDPRFIEFLKNKGVIGENGHRSRPINMMPPPIGTEQWYSTDYDLVLDELEEDDEWI